MAERAPEPAENATDKRLEDVEIKLAFLEKELEEYKEASRGFYKRINALEDEIRTLQKAVQDSGRPAPEPPWDTESEDLRP